MRKIFVIATAVLAMSLTACNKSDLTPAQKGGMTLTANTEVSKATINQIDETSWEYVWEEGDAIAVTSPSAETYSFVCDAEGTFSCETAVPEAGKWTAVFPANFAANGISLVNQPGTKDFVGDNLLLKGEQTCPKASGDLSMKMLPEKLAVLVITNGSTTDGAKYAIKDASGENYYVALNADGSWKMDSVKANGYVCQFKKVGETQYILVPAGKSIVIRGLSNASAANTLIAGHVYHYTTVSR